MMMILDSNMERKAFVRLSISFIIIIIVTSIVVVVLFPLLGKTFNSFVSFVSAFVQSGLCLSGSEYVSFQACIEGAWNAATQSL